MNIALMSHDHKKELMVQFCIAYCGVLSKHTVCATNTTGRLVARRPPACPSVCSCPMPTAAASRSAPGSPTTKIDMVLFFSDPQSSDLDPRPESISTRCATSTTFLSPPTPPRRRFSFTVWSEGFGLREIINPSLKPVTV